MTHSVLHSTSIPGYEGAGTIVIKYTIPSGTQTNEHPNPGTLTVLNVILIISMYRSATSWNNTFSLSTKHS